MLATPKDEFDPMMNKITKENNGSAENWGGKHGYLIISHLIPSFLRATRSFLSVLRAFPLGFGLFPLALLVSRNRKSARYAAIFFCSTLAAGACLEASVPAQDRGIDLLSAPFVPDAKGNVLLVIPKTRFDSDPAAYKRFLAGYAAGFRAVLSGMVSEYSPEKGPYFFAELEGWEEGRAAGERTRIYLAKRRS